MYEYLVNTLGLDPTSTDALTQTPLFYAARERKGEVVEFLVRKGCLVNHVDMYGQTAVFYAAREGHVDICKLLVKLGADCDVVDVNGQTVLYYAIKSLDAETVQYLIDDRGVDINIEDNKSVTPLVLAKRQGVKPIVNLLLQSGAKSSAEEMKRAAITNGKQIKK